MKLKIEQIILKEAFEYWVAQLDQFSVSVRVKFLYLYLRVGHTTLWKLLREERSDLLLIAETLILGRHHGFSDKFSVKSSPNSYARKLKDKIVIIDSGFF